MNRTDYPKYASYFGDGKGRDKYIILNNGGLAQQNKNYFARHFLYSQFHLSSKTKCTLYGLLKFVVGFSNGGIESNSDLDGSSKPNNGIV